MREIAVYLRGFTLFVAGIVVGTVLISPGAAQDTGKGGLRLNHVGIAVKDFQESLNFYTKVMGFKVAYAFPSPDGKPTTTFLQINRDTFLEMAPASANLPVGITHVGILTDDANGTRDPASSGRRNAARCSLRWRDRFAALQRYGSQWNPIRDRGAARRFADEKSYGVLEVTVGNG